jgi:hypothetical protein
VQLAGNTRVLIGPGGSIETVLTGNDYVAITMVTCERNSWNREQLVAVMQEYGEVTGAEIEHMASAPNQRQQAFSWAKVSFRTMAQAAEAVARAHELAPWRMRPFRPQTSDHIFIQVGT